MKLHEIRALPTMLRTEVILSELREFPKTSGWHESNLKAWQILAKVKEYMRRGTPSDVILEIIEDLERKESTGLPADGSAKELM